MIPRFLASLHVIAFVLASAHQATADDAAYMIGPETTQAFQWGTTVATWPGIAVIPATSGPVSPATITVSPGVPSDAVTDTVKVSIPKTEAAGSGKLFGRLQVVKP